MRPFFENVDMAVNTSLKVAVYNHKLACESIGWHIHPEYELVYIKNGSGTFRIDTKEIPYKDGGLIFLGPNIPHADFSNKEFEDNMEVVIQFPKEFVEDKLLVFPELKATRKLIRDAKSVILFDGKIKKKLTRDFEMFSSGGLTDAEKLVRAISLLEKLANHHAFKTILNSDKMTKRKSSDVQRLETIFEYVNEHYNERITTRLLANEIGLTTNSFCRFFKKMTDKPFIQFVNAFRIRKAIEFLETKNHSISEVMYRCGYSDASYFTKQFKRNTGHSPSEYINSYI